MKYGHVSGNKQEKTGSQAWYAAIEAENIARVEQEWQLKQAIEEYYAQLDEECAADELAEQAEARQAEDTAHGGLVARCSKTLLAGIATAVMAVGLMAGSADAGPKAKAPRDTIQEVAMVGTDARQYEVLVLLNDTLPVKAVIDTGATNFYQDRS